MDAHVRHERLDETALSRDQGFWNIYRGSFPACEQEPEAVIATSVRLKTGMAFRSVLSGATIAMATTHLLRRAPAVFLVYLAVDAGQKGRGTGGNLLEFIHADARLSAPGGLGLVWETERPEDAGDESERTVRERRLAFFQRHGAVVAARDYRQPALDGVAPVPMNLLFRPAEPGSSLEPAHIQALIRAIYFEKYGELNGISTRHLEDLLAGVQTPRSPGE